MVARLCPKALAVSRISEKPLTPYRQLVQRRSSTVVLFWGLLLCLTLIAYAEGWILGKHFSGLLFRCIATLCSITWFIYVLLELKTLLWKYKRVTLVSRDVSRITDEHASHEQKTAVLRASSALCNMFPGRVPGRPPPETPLPSRVVMRRSSSKLPTPRKGVARGLSTGPRAKPQFVLGRRLYCDAISTVPKNSFFGKLHGKTVGIETTALREASRSLLSNRVKNLGRTIARNASTCTKIFSDTKAQHLAIVLAKLNLPIHVIQNTALIPMKIPRIIFVGHLTDTVNLSESQGACHQALSWLSTNDRLVTVGHLATPQRSWCPWCCYIYGIVTSPSPRLQTSSTTECKPPPRCCLNVLGYPDGCLSHLSEDIEKLLQVVPSPQDLDAMRRFTGELHHLRDIEQKVNFFYETLARRCQVYAMCLVPNIEPRLRLWKYAFDLVPQYEGAHSSLERLLLCLQHIQDSQSLQWCFIGVLEIINFINAPQANTGYRPDDWKIKGVNLADALRFNDFKSVHPRFRLTHYLILALNQRLFDRRPTLQDTGLTPHAMQAILGTTCSKTGMLPDIGNNLCQMFPPSSPCPKTGAALLSQRSTDDPGSPVYETPPRESNTETEDDALSPLKASLQRRMSEEEKTLPTLTSKKPLYCSAKSSTTAPISQATYRKVSTKFESITDNARKELPLLSECCKYSASGFAKQLEDAGHQLHVVERDVERWPDFEDIRSDVPLTGTVSPQWVVQQGQATMKKWTKDWDIVIEKSSHVLEFFCDTGCLVNPASPSSPADRVKYVMNVGDIMCAPESLTERLKF